jgi:glycosyl transferase family 25
MLKCYLINLDKDGERLRLMQARFAELGLPVERVAAVDGKAMTDSAFREFATARPLKKTPWMRGQAGCFLSHFSVWEKIAASSDAVSAIFEDDLKMAGDLPLFLQDSAWIPAGCDIVRLEPPSNRVLLSRSGTVHAGRSVRLLKSTSWCAGAYLIRRETAQKLIALPLELHERSDAFLFSHEDAPVARQLNTYQLSPALCVQGKFTGDANPAFKSNIEPDALAVVRGGAFIKKLNSRALYKLGRGYQKIRFRDGAL